MEPFGIPNSSRRLCQVKGFRCGGAGQYFEKSYVALEE